MTEVELVAEWGQPRSLDEALRQAETTAQLGWTWAKWQVVEPERLASRYAERYWDFWLGGSQSQRETFAGRQLTLDEWRKLSAACRDLDIRSMVTPFHVEAVRELVKTGVDGLKIASGDITFRDLIAEVGRAPLPIVLSTGAATLYEIRRALSWLRRSPHALLACDLRYPCPFGESRIAQRLPELREMGLGQRLGYSDHTPGVEAATVAVTLGATVLEKHLTLDPAGGAPDDRMALVRSDAAVYKRRAQDAAELCTTPSGDPEARARVGARRSAFAAQNLEAGRQLEQGDVEWLRPAVSEALTPVDRYAGRTLVQAVAEGESIMRTSLV